MTHRSFADTSPPDAFERKVCGSPDLLSGADQNSALRQTIPSAGLSDVRDGGGFVRAPELPEVERAVVRGQEIEEPLVVLGADAEERQHRPVIAIGVLQS